MNNDERELIKLELDGFELTGINANLIVRISNVFDNFNRLCEQIDNMNEVYNLIKYS